MRLTERLAFRIRHSPGLERAECLWNALRPFYDRISAISARHGLERIINGTDRLLIAPAVREMPETYEPDVWRSLMREVRGGDVVADVGAFTGVYTIALAKRVGPLGRVFAFEPDPFNFGILRKHIALNAVDDRVEAIQAAVGANEGEVSIVCNQSESHITTSSADRSSPGGAITVSCLMLDSIFANRRVDLMKIDVEGYEEAVLRGGTRLLSDRVRGPRMIVIEVHPFAWDATGTSSESLLTLLRELGYRVTELDGEQVARIDAYGEIVAHRVN